MSTGKLDNKVAIVTGAGAGLGAACALGLASHGARVAVADIDPQSAEAVAAAIRERGGQAIGVRADVSSEAQVQAMVAEVTARFGRIDVLHNNAAALDAAQRAADRDVCSLTVEAWDRAMNVNARGAMLCCKHVIPVMLRHGSGSIIHSSSGFGAQGDLTLTAYAASKAALAILSKSIAAQYGKQGVRSNTIQIGFVVNEHAQKSVPEQIKRILLEQHLTPYLGSPKHIADVVAFLASDESAFITGDTLAVDGGFSSHTPSMVAMKTFFESVGSNKL